ncbi:unnamed protein product [Spirodela intermedia]|uniref:Alliinase C-terminal domain-containing protein n=1 Tax=Spirodela intermedia TaxID=51605 RepID=A0A7I8LJT0_SPIIN|nr:unnamed protein product [Spirodela intermedia]
MGEASPELPSPPPPFSSDGDGNSVPINLEQGDPTMFEEYWRSIAGDAAVVIPAWQGMSYLSSGAGVCWFMEPKLAEEIVRLHKLVGNARTAGWHIVVGVGSTQLFQAALFALSPPDAGEPINVVSAAPYYSYYPAVVEYLRSGLYRWAGDARAFRGDAPYIEVVCTPNNPDGFLNRAVLREEKGRVINDLAYYWPQYTAITYEADHEIMLFTFSKLTGHAGTRIGWALVKDEDVARKMTKFIELNTIGVSKDSQLRAAKIMGTISDSYEAASPPPVEERFFSYSRCVMAARWRRLRQAVESASSFSLPEFPSPLCRFSGEKSGLHPAFAWLKCEREDAEDCESFLKSLGIRTRGGAHFGADRRYVRVSMLARDEMFDFLIKTILSVG